MIHMSQKRHWLMQQHGYKYMLHVCAFIHFYFILLYNLRHLWISVKFNLKACLFVCLFFSGIRLIGLIILRMPLPTPPSPQWKFHKRLVKCLCECCCYFLIFFSFISFSGGYNSNNFNWIKCQFLAEWRPCFSLFSKYE